MRLVTLNDLRCHHEIVILWFWVKCFNSYWNKYHEICKRASKVYSEHSVNTALPILDWILHKHIKSISILGWNSFMFLSINKVFCFQPCSILNCWSCSYQSYFAASNSYILSLFPMLTSAPLLRPLVVRRTSTERRTSSDHIKGIVFPSDDPGDRGRGGWTTSCGHPESTKNAKPCKGQIKQMDSTQFRKMNFHCNWSSSAVLLCRLTFPSIKVSLHHFCSAWYACFTRFIYFLPHLYPVSFCLFLLVHCSYISP